MPRIGLDVTMLARPRTGVESYVRTLAENLPGTDHRLEFVFFSAVPLPDRLPAPLIAPARPGSYGWWRQAHLPQWLRLHRIDLFHSPLAAVPVAVRQPVVSSIHDVIWALYPHTYSVRRRLGHRFWCAVSVRISRRIIVQSQATAASLCALHPRQAARRIVVIPTCLPSPMAVGEEGNRPSAALERLGIREPFLLTVGTVQPRKNYERLITAFEQMSAAVARGLQLVIVGRDGYGAADVHRRARESSRAGQICLIGYVTDAELRLLYRRATAFVFPSLYEGFGLPLLEAMAAGTPVAASNTSSLSEVGGDAAVYFDPVNPGEMAAVLERVLSDSALRERLIEAGRQRVKLFTPQRMAEATARLYLDVLHENSASDH